MSLLEDNSDEVDGVGLGFDGGLERMLNPDVDWKGWIQTSIERVGSGRW